VKITPDKIMAIVAEEYGLKVSDLTGPSRDWHIVDPRALAMDLIHDRCSMSYDNIAPLFNRSIPAAYSNSRNFRKRLLKMGWQELGKILEARSKTFNGFAA
jgi:chromosomal replication initiation ATPase DnaA